MNDLPQQGAKTLHDLDMDRAESFLPTHGNLVQSYAAVNGHVVARADTL